ncbi:unnamed protein product [Acanthocheilonema viteae]|uniref:Uncharacterized protein n=1 Tax=Acanthocheilonema viteae TaxID=6277 RepID=A0A498SET8_ACAVI|nr:unnamed protein product [Acanthocheilonema viteae]
MLDWSRKFGSVKSFVLRNLNTTDANFCGTLLDFVRKLNAKARKRLEIALLEELDDIWNDRNRSYQATFILELLKQCGFDRWFTDIPLMDSIFNSDIANIKIKLLTCLSPAMPDCEIFLTDKFVEMLNNDSIDGLNYLVKVMLQFKEPKEILDLMKETKHKDSNSVKITLTSLIENFAVESVFDPSFWFDVCIKSNVDLISFSGSEHSGQCASLPELYRRLYPSASPTLMISDKQRKAIDQYYHTLKINCEMLASLCETIGTKNIIKDAYSSVWNVLMRSRHKAALVHKLIDDAEYGIPLFTFLFRYDLLWHEYCQQLEQATVHDPALILLLSLLEKLRFVSKSFYATTQLKHLQSMVSKLVSLLVVSPNLRVNHLLVTSLLRLIPYKRRLTYRLKRIMEHKLPLNIKNALSYAISELEAMEFLYLPSDPLHSFSSHSTTLLPSLIQKTHKMLTDSTLKLFEHFGVLLMEIEKHAYSSKELWRFYAAHALVILSRTSCNILIHFHSYRYRFIFCCRSLLLDEVDCIRRVAFRALNVCDSGAALSFSWDLANKLKRTKEIKKTLWKGTELQRPGAFEDSS